jgi:hypothetical protein
MAKGQQRLQPLWPAAKTLGSLDLSTVPYLLQQGNTKLGENVFHFSIPAWQTCPGRSAACSACYALQGRYRTTTVRDALQRGYDASLEEGFALRMIREVHRRWCRVVRIHVAGDFYSAEYAAKWVEVVRRCPDTTFYAYTRSWRVEDIHPVLIEMAHLDNFRLWFSADSDTGRPPDIEGVRIAWLMQDAAEVIEDADLIFRDKPLRQVKARRIGLTLVCPTENGSDVYADCVTCKFCWK